MKPFQKKVKLLILVLAVTMAAGISWGKPAKDPGLKIFGYYSAWSIYSRKYYPKDVPLDKITHLIYSFANIKWDKSSGTGTVVIGDPFADLQKNYGNEPFFAPFKGNFYQFNVHYKKSYKYQSLISIGGWTWSKDFSNVASTEKSRRIFAKSVADFVVKYQFDGVDVNWEYPTSESGPGTIHRPEDKTNYTLLVQCIRAALDESQKKDGKTYIMTASTAGTWRRIDEIEPLKLSKYVDYILLMSYEFRGQWDPVTGHNAQLYANPKDPISDAKPDYKKSRVNVHDGVQKYISYGVSKDKLVLGIPFYGRGYTGVPDTNNGLFQKFTGTPQSPIGEPGFFPYPYCRAFKGKEYWDDVSRASWKYDGDFFLSFESPRAIISKIRYIKKYHLAGIMYWEFSADQGNTLAGIVYDNL
jgi:chitinase